MNTKLLVPSKIIRTRRRSIALIVDRNGDLIVRAPLKSKDSEIDKFINKKANWIIEKRTLAKKSGYKKLKFKGAEQITILGKTYSIELTESKRVKIDNDRIIVPNTNSENYLKNYLIRTCKKYLPPRLDKLCENYGFTYNGITITSATTRWGSCGYKNTLNFTYKLIMCPKDVVEYLLVHELCHTKVKNHSAKFWQKVESILPNYKEQENWLKVNRRIIDVI